MGPTLLDLAGFQTSARGRGILLGEVGERERSERDTARETQESAGRLAALYTCLDNTSSLKFPY